jgi:steroid 5-alpha reductase family enzyme
MFEWPAFLIALGVILTAGTGVWLASLLKRDVSIVDSLWPMMFLLAAVTYDLTLVDTGPRAALLLVLVGIWALRLFAYITWRNWGEDEDRRYQAIRANNEPNFELKSLFIVFILQGVIAWIVSLPLMPAIGSAVEINALDYVGLGLWAIGMLFEAGGDYQLTRFKSDPENRGKVMDRGLWRYTRHPNYFGNACIWWGFGLLAVAAGAWWALLSPLLMTFLLLKVSGVSLLEQDIGDRRPAYADYIARTSAFIPLPPKKRAASAAQSADRG